MRAIAFALAFATVLTSCAPREPQPDRGPEPEPMATAAPRSPSPAATAATQPARLALPDRFTALGTEPFWAAEVDGDTLLYKTPDDQAGQRVAVSRRATRDAVQLRGDLAGAPVSLVVTAGPCSDGMSDRVYPFSVARSLGGDLQQGCARAD